MAWAVMAMIGRWAPERFLVRADDRGGLETIHVGHLHVHQDEIESVGAWLIQRGQRFFSVRGDDHGVAALSEQARGDQLVDLVVLGQQNAQLSPAFAQGVAGDRRDADRPGRPACPGRRGWLPRARSD